MYSRIIIIALLFTNFYTVGVLYHLAEKTPKPTRLVLLAAHKSYFVACTDALAFAGFPKDDSISICKESALNYLQELTAVIGEETPETD